MFYSHPSDSNKDPGSSPNGVLFFFGPSLAKAEFSFTAGKEEDDRLIEIVVIIKDAYGESVENKLQIQVLFFSCFLCRCCCVANNVHSKLQHYIFHFTYTELKYSIFSINKYGPSYL